MDGWQKKQIKQTPIIGANIELTESFTGVNQAKSLFGGSNRHNDTTRKWS
jgi:hypothetical protein